MAVYKKVVFKDRNSGNALFTADLPEGFQAEAVYTPVQYPTAQSYTVRGTAVHPEVPVTFFFRTGEGYFYSERTPVPAGGRTEDGTIVHYPCDTAALLDEYASEFAGTQLTAMDYRMLTDRKQAIILPEAEREVQKMYNVYCQVANMNSGNIYLNVDAYINDGGTGIYSLLTDRGKKTLAVTLYRYGMYNSMGMNNTSMLGMFASQARPISTVSWVVPVVTYVLVNGEINEGVMAVYNRFTETLQMTPQFKAFREELENRNLQASLQKAAYDAQQTNAQIQYAWQQHQEGWARSDALSRQISADLDSFHQNIHAQAQAYDNAHMNFGNSGSGFGGSADEESLDDRIQRRRHEAMMGVDTYEREDGTTVEHTTMDNRVFENNLDSRERFGTEHYYDDYVPDGWSELFRRH